MGMGMHAGRGMRATVCRRYGAPDVLAIEDVDTPVPADGEVLVRVLAASLNSWDWDNLCGKPYVFRLFSGLSKPRVAIPGADIAGRVEAVGKGVTQFRPGDEVFGDLCASGWGAFAEYVCAPADALAHKPRGVTFEQAAALPQAGVMALQGIVDYAKVEAGQKILINGAGGGVGTFAIQLAKSYGAEVTGVDRGSKLSIMRAVGADHVIDYAAEDFTRNGERYDVILDVVGKRSMFDYGRALKDGGVYIMVGAPLARIAQLLVLKKWFSLTSGKRLVILMHEPNKDLEQLKLLIESGTIEPVIDGSYTLDELPQAYAELGAGRVLGKAVITMASEARS